MNNLKETLLNHPRNEKIRFYEDEHEYYFYESGDFRKTTERVQFDGITNWIKSFCEKFDADKVIDKYYDWWQQNNHEEYGGLTKQEIKKLWSDKGNDARDKGNLIHKTIENNVNLGVYDEDNGFYIDRFWECMDEKGIEPIVSEIVVYDEDIQRATPIDLVGAKDGKIIPIDIKSFEDELTFLGHKGKTMKHPLGHVQESKFDKVSLQVSIARKWLIDKYGFDEEDVDDGAVLLLNDDGAKFCPVYEYGNEVEAMYEYE